MAETHDPCPRNAHPREAGKGEAVRCHSYWALGDALPGLSHLVLAPLLSVLHCPRLPAGIFIVLSCACRNCSAVLFLFVSNFFQCLFLLLAFLSFSIPLLSQFDTTKIKPIITFDMKDKSKHPILPCNTGHMKCLGIKKSSSRSIRVNYFFREIYAIKKGHQLRSTFRLAGAAGHPQSGWTSSLKPRTTSVSFPRHFVSSDLYYHIFSTFCVCRAVANGKLVTSKRVRNRACNLVEHHHIKSSQELCGKRFSHLGPVRNSAANSTTCRSMKLHLGTEFWNVFSLCSFFACSCLKYTWNCSTWSNFLSFYVGF